MQLVRRQVLKSLVACITSVGGNGKLLQVLLHRISDGGKTL